MSIVSIASSAPATSASVSGPRPAGEGEDGAVVVGVGVAVEQRGAAREGAPRARVRRSRVAPLGDVGDGEQGRHARAQTQQLAAADDRLAVDFDRRFEDHAVEVDRDLDGAADRRRGAEGDVGGAEDLLVLEDVAGQDRLFVGADPELGDVGAVLAVRGEQLHQRRAVGAGRVGQVAARGRSARPASRAGRRRRSSRRRPACPPPSPRPGR